jgi:hypothetical protein
VARVAQLLGNGGKLVDELLDVLDVLERWSGPHDRLLVAWSIIVRYCQAG